MNYLERPSLPEGPVGLAVVDGRISPDIEQSLLALGIELIKAAAYVGLYEAVACHPDLVIHPVSGKKIVYAPGIAPAFLKSLQNFGFHMIPGSTVLSSPYPGHIAYNAARIGNKLFHHLKYTDGVLRKELEKEGVELIHVNQGYAKCAVSVLGPNRIMTSDCGIAEAAGKNGVEVLLLEEQNILLPGLSCGFIGGSSGLIDRNKLAVTGKAQTLKSFDKIHTYMEESGMEIHSLSSSSVTDYGSILPLMTR